MSTKFVMPLSRASDAGITELTVAPLAAKQRARLPYALVMKITAREDLPMRVFRFSITYLMWLFAALLIDHYLPTTQGNL